MSSDEKMKAILEEVRTAYCLIEAGLIHLNKMKENAYTFHLPLTELYNGIERLLKCIILIDYNFTHGKYPNDRNFFKRTGTRLISGHDLNNLFDSVFEIYKSDSSHSKMKGPVEDYDYIEKHYLPTKLIKLTAEFAVETRYRNLNVLLGSNGKNYKSPEEEVIKLIEHIIKIEFEDLNNDEYNLFDLAIREMFICYTKIIRFLSRFFIYSGQAFDLNHISRAWGFIKLYGDPVLNISEYKR